MNMSIRLHRVKSIKFTTGNLQFRSLENPRRTTNKKDSSRVAAQARYNIEKCCQCFMGFLKYTSFYSILYSSRCGRRPIFHDIDFNVKHANYITSLKWLIDSWRMEPIYCRRYATCAIVVSRNVTASYPSKHSAPVCSDNFTKIFIVGFGWSKKNKIWKCFAFRDMIQILMRQQCKVLQMICSNFKQFLSNDTFSANETRTKHCKLLFQTPSFVPVMV